MNQPSLFGPANRVVVFDLETIRSFQEVGGRGGLSRLGMSLAVLYDYAADSYQTFREAEASALVDELLDASLVVGFNVKGFDYLVLSAYRPEIRFQRLPTLDLLEHVQAALGFRVKLDNLAQASLGRGKGGSGLDALRWYREGRFDLLERYCQEDVEVTRRLYELGRDRGELRFTDRDGTVRPFRVNW